MMRPDDPTTSIDCIIHNSFKDVGKSRKNGLKREENVDIVEDDVVPLGCEVLETQKGLASTTKSVDAQIASKEDENIENLQQKKSTVSEQSNNPEWPTDSSMQAGDKEDVAYLSKTMERLSSQLSSVLLERTEEQRRLRQHELDQISYQKDLVKESQKSVREMHRDLQTITKSSYDLSLSQQDTINTLRHELIKARQINRDVTRNNTVLTSRIREKDENIHKFAKVNQEYADANEILTARIARIWNIHMLICFFLGLCSAYYVYYW